MIRLVPLVLFALMFCAACEERLKPAISPDVVGQDVPTQESWNAIINFSDSGRTRAILRAGHIASFSDRHITLLDSSIVVDFFDETDQHTSTLTARRGKVDDVTKNFEAQDDVIVVSDSGTTLRTSVLYWNNATGMIHTPAFVVITSPTERIQGHGLESDRGLKEYRIFRVTGQAKTDE